jgi:hypothetical protein
MGWFAQIINQINTEYERRIKAASQITEYGAHHDHGIHDTNGHADELEDDAGAEITNLPPGTKVSHQTTPDKPQH